MTDADVDGSHIRTLLLTFFFRHMQELIKRGHVFVAQPPLYLIKKGKTQKYIKDDKEFTREILRRATENLTVEAQDGTKLEGAELRAFLISLDEFQQISRRMERRLRDARVVEVLANIDFKVDTKADFQEKSNLEPVVAALTAAKVTARLEREEEHEAWKVMYHDPTNAERGITIDLALQPEFRRMRTIARQVSKFNRPPFKILKEGKAEAEDATRGLARAAGTGEERGHARGFHSTLQRAGRDERRTAMGHHHERRNAHAAEGGPARSGGDRNHLFHADGRGCGEPAEVYRRERAGRAESGRLELKQCPNAHSLGGFVESGITGGERNGFAKRQFQVGRIVDR